MTDFLSKLIVGVITGTLYFLIYAFFAYLTISAFQCDLPMIGAICFSITLGGIVYPIIAYYDKKKEKRLEALRKMYNLPQYIRGEYGEVWDKEFQRVIKRAIDTTTDSEKLTDLKHCQRVAKEMIKDSGAYRLDRPFYKINNAFRLTGCHFTIIDSQGTTIAKIV